MDIRHLLKVEPPSDKVTAALLADLGECQQLFNSEPTNQFRRRTVVRTCLASVEGLNNFLCQWCYSYHERNVRPLYDIFKVLKIDPPSLIFAEIQSEADLLLLVGTGVTLNERGDIKTKSAYHPLERSIRFLFQMTERVFHTGHQPDYSVRAWGSLQMAIAVRNRLMHPKGVTDLEVHESEIEATSEGCQWYLDTAAEAMTKAGTIALLYEDERQGFLNSLPREKLVAIVEATSSAGVPLFPMT